MKKLFATAFAMGLLSLVAFAFERMALTDIYHGEPDLSLEWSMVNVALLPMFAFHILGLVALATGWRKLSRLP